KDPTVLFSVSSQKRPLMIPNNSRPTTTLNKRQACRPATALAISDPLARVVAHSIDAKPFFIAPLQPARRRSLGLASPLPLHLQDIKVAPRKGKMSKAKNSDSRRRPMHTPRYRDVGIKSRFRPDYYEFWPVFNDTKLAARISQIPLAAATHFSPPLMIPNNSR